MTFAFWDYGEMMMTKSMSDHNDINKYQFSTKLVGFEDGPTCDFGGCESL